MRFDWNEQTIGWFMDAGAYTGFHKTLAELIVPHLAPGGTLCDLGCGLGRLDIELAPFMTEITAVDINESALIILRDEAAASGLNNLTVMNSDAAALTGTFDVVLMSFFGQSNMLEFLKLCRRRLIRIVSADNKSGLYPQKYRCKVKDTVPIVQDELDAKGISYKLYLHSIEFGQPLRSWQDAIEYILKNAPEASIDEVNDFLNKSIIHTDESDFPLYLPNQKELGIFVLDKVDAGGAVKPARPSK